MRFKSILPSLFVTGQMTTNAVAQAAETGFRRSSATARMGRSPTSLPPPTSRPKQKAVICGSCTFP